MTRDEFVKKYTETAWRTLQCSMKARKEGLMAFNEELNNELSQKKINERDIFEYGMRFVIDGTDAQLINNILSTIILQEKDEYTRKLKVIQAEAILSIQAGDNPKYIYYKLNSFTDIPIEEDDVYKKLTEIL